MSVIPSELILDIFSRLLAATLLRFRRVCKDWCHVIDSPYFIKIHLMRQLSSNGVGHLLFMNSDRQLYSLSLNLLNSGCPLKFETTRIMNPNPFKNHVTIKGSCNGLILVYCGGQSLWSIWNPLTQERHELPLNCRSIIRKSSDLVLGIVNGFGYDCGADDYKVLTQTQYCDEIERIVKFETCVYSLKSDSWKRIEDFPFWIMNWGLDNSSGVFYNGALHWIGKRFHENGQNYNICTVAFDLKTEDCRSYPLPTFDRFQPCTWQLNELGGCLSMSLYIYNGSFETWLLNDYGVKNSWTKLISEKRWTFSSRFDCPRTIIYSKSKKLVILQNSENEVCWYDPKNNAMENVSIPEKLELFSSQVFLSSLVRIKRNQWGMRKREECE